MPVFDRENPDWRSSSMPPLPEWLSITHLLEGSDALYYHSALVISFNIHPQTPEPPKTRSARILPNGWVPSSDSSDAAECVVYTPHGVRPEALKPLAFASPPLSVLALIHGLHDVAIEGSFWWERTRLVQQLNLGGYNGLQAQRLLGAKYWIGTHDEIKTGGGLVSWFLNRKVISVEEALRAEKDRLLEQGEMEDEKMDRMLDKVHFEEVGNGESRVLV